MPSAVFSECQGRQVALELDESLVSAHRSVRDVVASGVYKRGLKNVAMDLDLSPGNLSVALSDDPHRKFSVDELETYIQRTGDKSPIYYLVTKYLGNEAAARDHALAQVGSLLAGLPEMLAAAGLNKAQPTKRAR